MPPGPVTRDMMAPAATATTAPTTQPAAGPHGAGDTRAATVQAAPAAMTRLPRRPRAPRRPAAARSIYQSGIGTFQLIDDGTTAWVLPNPDFWTYSGTKYAAVAPALTGKYLQLTPGASGLGALTGFCSLTALVGTGPSPLRKTGFAAPALTTVGGLPAVKIADKADGGYAIVSDTAQPQLLRFYVPGLNGGSLSFAYYATPVTVSAPAATEVVDGSQYGL